METVDQDGAPSEPRVAERNEHRLQLQLHTDEAVWMRQIGHLKDWCAQTSAIHLGVPARVPTPLAASSLRLLWLFQNLRELDINFNSTRARIEQPVVLACAELLNLTSLQLLGGHLARRGLDLGVLTSLRRLRALAVRPQGDEELDGLEDEHLAGAARLTGLESLSLRASESVTDEGITALTTLTGLTRLSLLPLGLYVTREGISALSDALRHLDSLSVGLHECRQVAAIKGLEERPRRPAPPPPEGSSPPPAAGAAATAAAAVAPSAALPAISLVVNSPEVSTSGFFSTLTLVLRPRLVSLRMATVEATEPSFLLALGTLVHLSELKMGISLPEGGEPFTCNLATLSSLGKLHTLEFAVTQELRMPLSVKMVSLLSLSWPRLRSLSLSAMTKPEVMPEALDLLDNFHHLTSLSLFAPLDYCSDDDPSAHTLPVNPRYLPRGLKHLVLECAHLRDQPYRTGAAAAAAAAAAAGTAATSTSRQQQQGQSTPPHQNGGAPAPASPGPGSEAPDEAAAAKQEGGDGVGATRGSVLPHLEHLELNSCRTSDEHLGALLGGAAGMRHLELTDVKGISDAALSALRTLNRLEHLVVRISDAAGPAATASGTSAGTAGISQRSLGALRNASTLRHLEWSLPQPLGVAAAEEALTGLLSSLDGLQELYLDVVPELRAGAGPGAGERGRGGAAAASASAASASAGGREGSGGDGSGTGGHGSWRDRLQRALPLCTVAERPGIILYDLWNDRTVQVVGP